MKALNKLLQILTSILFSTYLFIFLHIPSAIGQTTSDYAIEVRTTDEIASAIALVLRPLPSDDDIHPHHGDPLSKLLNAEQRPSTVRQVEDGKLEVILTLTSEDFAPGSYLSLTFRTKDGEIKSEPLRPLFIEATENSQAKCVEPTSELNRRMLTDLPSQALSDLIVLRKDKLERQKDQFRTLLTPELIKMLEIYAQKKGLRIDRPLTPKSSLSEVAYIFSALEALEDSGQ